MRCLMAALSVLWALCLVPASAQPRPTPVLTDRPDVSMPGTVLEETFVSRGSGISFGVPAGLKQQRRGVGEEIVRYASEDNQRVLSVVRREPTRPLPLESVMDEQGRPIAGMQESAATQIALDYPGAEMLRDDIIQVGTLQVGLLAARVTMGLETRLLQQALVRLDNTRYFQFTYLTPAPRGDRSELENHLDVRRDVTAFLEMVDSVQLLDQSSLRREQEDRLFRTRALLVNWKEPRLQQALVSEQWLRLIRDGKDIGYSYVVEEIGDELPRAGRTNVAKGGNGILIGVRSRTMPEPGVRVDAESWQYVSFDRRQENWSTIAVIDNGQEKSHTGELGSSLLRIRPVADEWQARGDNRGVSLTEDYRLTVTPISNYASGNSTEFQLPPFYLPQALGHLLPRLVPLNEPKGYLFATYVSEPQRSIMLRYVDVGREQQVNLAGRNVRAVPIKDRLGVEGSVTIHYMSPDGRYLGSVNNDSKIMILPTDEETLRKLWQDADLTRPGDVSQ